MAFDISVPHTSSLRHPDLFVRSGSTPMAGQFRLI